MEPVVLGFSIAILCVCALGILVIGVYSLVKSRAAAKAEPAPEPSEEDHAAAALAPSTENAWLAPEGKLIRLQVRTNEVYRDTVKAVFWRGKKRVCLTWMYEDGKMEERVYWGIPVEIRMNFVDID